MKMFNVVIREYVGGPALDSFLTYGGSAQSVLESIGDDESRGHMVYVYAVESGS